MDAHIDIQMPSEIAPEPYTGSQAGKRRLVFPQPIANLGAPGEDEATVDARERAMLKELGPDCVMMMGENPALPKMPEKPTLMDFFKLRFSPITRMHLLQSAKLALDAGLEEKVVLACLLHDCANGALIRTDHGYWGAQLIAPYVDEEVAWAVKYHQALRFYPDESVGYGYPEAYVKYFGEDYVPLPHIRRAYEEAKDHRFYMTSRLITLYDIYSFDDNVTVDPELFTDVVGRHFRQPEEGLGFDDSPVAHMWRTMIWPNNFL